jgi:hypothetical protein
MKVSERAPERPAANGLQLSYRRAVRTLAAEFEAHGMWHPYAVARAERVLRGARSDRQRACLDAREGESPT